MRGEDGTGGGLFSYIDLEERVPAPHPLRLIREIMNPVLASLSSDFAALYAMAVVPMTAEVADHGVRFATKHAQAHHKDWHRRGQGKGKPKDGSGPSTPDGSGPSTPKDG